MIDSKKLALVCFAITLSSCSQKSNLKGGTATAKVEAKAVSEESSIDASPKDEEEVMDPVEIPGEPTRTVGINFEDNFHASGGTPNDYNDAVLCFEGTFSITPDRKIISTSDQTIQSKTFSEANCKQKLEISIVSADGDRKTQIVFPDSKSTEESEVKLVFKKGDELEVTMIPLGPFPCADDKERKHTETQYSQVEKTCNNTSK